MAAGKAPGAGAGLIAGSWPWRIGRAFPGKGHRTGAGIGCRPANHPCRV